MSNFTSGPWVKVNDCTVRGPNGQPVASTKGFAYPVCSDYEANARLIAAAPETYELLLEVWMHLLGYVPRSEKVQDLCEKILAIHNRIENKAEGRE